MIVQYPAAIPKPLEISNNPTPPDIDAYSMCTGAVALTGDSGFKEYIHNNTPHKGAPPKPRKTPKPSSVPQKSYMNVGIIIPSTSAPTDGHIDTHSDDKEGK